MTTQNRQGIAVRLSAVALTMLAGCLSPSTPPVEKTQLPIVGGTNAPLCAWPSVVFLSNHCSGTLVHPQVVVTAAHCTDGKEAPVPTSVSFGENAIDSPAKTVKVSKCKASPKFSRNSNTYDIGYCVLAQPVTDMPIIPVMAACEAPVLKAGMDIMEVGYGVSTAKSGSSEGLGVKRFIAGKIDSVNANAQTKVTTGSQSGEYFGDSGGPLFFQMADKTWRHIGADCCSPDIVSGSTAPRVSTYTSSFLNAAWLESDSGFDLTPCHDGSAWNPGSLCGTLPTTPDKASGAWSSMCAETQNLTAPQPTCNASGGDGGTGDARGDSDTGGADAGGGGDDAGRPDAGKADASDATNSKDGDSGKDGSAGVGGTTGGSSTETGGDAGSTGNAGTGGSSQGGASASGGIAGTGGSLATNGGSVAGHGGSSASRGGSSQSGGNASTGGSLGASGGSVAGQGGSSAGKGGSSGSGKTTSEAKSGGNGCSYGVAAAGRPGAWQTLAVALGLLAFHRRRQTRRSRPRPPGTTTYTVTVRKDRRGL